MKVTKSKNEFIPKSETPEAITKAWEVVRDHLAKTIEKRESEGNKESITDILGLGTESEEEVDHWISILTPDRPETFTAEMSMMLKASPSLARFTFLTFQLWMNTGLKKGRSEAKAEFLREAMEAMLGSKFGKA